MNRKEAMELVLAEAFAETGLGALADHGGDPGFERLETLKSALGLLHDDLAVEDTFDRQFVSALFVLGSRVPEAVSNRNPKAPGYRRTFAEQAETLVICVNDLIENWNNWPDWESHPLRTYRFATGNNAE